MKWMKWSKTDINTIKISPKQKFRYKKGELAERLSNHLGVDIESVKMKIRELREMKGYNTSAVTLERRNVMPRKSSRGGV